LKCGGGGGRAAGGEASGWCSGKRYSEPEHITGGVRFDVPSPGPGYRKGMDEQKCRTVRGLFGEVQLPRGRKKLLR